MTETSEGKSPYVRDCMPEMADVVSGRYPRPVELPVGATAAWRIATPDGEVFWPNVCPAWRVLRLGDADGACTVARRGRPPDKLAVCVRVRRTVEELRDLLGERGAAVCVRGRVYVFNSDGTRVAIEGDD